MNGWQVTLLLVTVGALLAVCVVVFGVLSGFAWANRCCSVRGDTNHPKEAPPS